MISGISNVGKYPVFSGSLTTISKNRSLTKPDTVSQPQSTNSPYTAVYPLLLIPETDVYSLKYIDKYVNSETVQKAINTNPRITAILAQYDIKPKVNEKNIDNKLKRHLFTSYLYAVEIADKIKLNQNAKKHLAQATLVHDIGKALIPDNILQKPSKLSNSEKEIVDLHSQLGYEILKTTSINPDIPEAVRLHHTPFYSQNGSIIAEILSVADVFSALKEERIYKKSMSDEQAFRIMSDTPNLCNDFVTVLRCIRDN